MGQRTTWGSPCVGLGPVPGSLTYLQRLTRPQLVGKLPLVGFSLEKEGQGSHVSEGRRPHWPPMEGLGLGWGGAQAF